MHRPCHGRTCEHRSSTEACEHITQHDGACTPAAGPKMRKWYGQQEASKAGTQAGEQKPEPEPEQQEGEEQRDVVLVTDAGAWSRKDEMSTKRGKHLHGFNSCMCILT